MSNNRIFTHRNIVYKPAITMEITVESLPLFGVCNLCLNEGAVKSMLADSRSVNYTSYATMLLNCFSVDIASLELGDTKHLICDLCVTKLMECLQFKDQVLASLRSLEESAKLFRNVECQHIKLECQTIKKEWEEETDGQQECGVLIKEEPKWTAGLTSSLKCVVKEESGLLDLYAGHKVEEDLVLGPEGPQLPDSAFRQPTCADSLHCSQGDPAEEPNNSVSLEQSSGHDVALCGWGSGNPEPNNQIQMRQSTASFPFDEELKECSVDRLHASLQFPPKSSLPKSYTCEVCMKQFTNKSHLEAHKKIHGVKDYCCDVCLKQFTCRKHLMRHKLTHTGDKPYSCDVCVKNFAQKCHLNVHKRTHTGEKPYSCDVCVKKFAQKCHLIVHRRTHSGEKPFSCDVCVKKFSTIGNLITHKRTHTGEKPYSCDVCIKQFTQIGDLVVHRQTHTGEKPHSCNVCMKKFKSKRSLNVHRRVHTRE